MSGPAAAGGMRNVHSTDAAGSGRAARRFRPGLPRLGTLNVGFAFGFIGLLILLAITADWIPGSRRHFRQRQGLQGPG